MVAASDRRCDEEKCLDGKDRGIGHDRRSKIESRAHPPAPCRQSRRCRRRWPARRRTAPCARPRARSCRWWPAEHRADGSHREDAIAEAERKDRGLQRPARPHLCSCHQPDKRERRADAADATVQLRRLIAVAAQQGGGSTHKDHAEQHARVLHARQRRRLARRQPEDQAREGLEDQVLRAVGQHGHEDEDRRSAGPSDRPRPRRWPA